MKEKFILTCSCGCSTGVEFKWLDNIYISFFSGLFYSEQPQILRYIRTNWRKIKSGCFQEILTSEEDLLALKSYLEQLTCTDDPVDNLGNIEFSYESDFECYVITLEYKPTMREIVTGKLYRVYEFEINESGRQKLISNLVGLIEQKNTFRI